MPKIFSLKHLKKLADNLDSCLLCISVFCVLFAISGELLSHFILSERRHSSHCFLKYVYDCFIVYHCDTKLSILTTFCYEVLDIVVTAVYCGLIIPLLSLEHSLC